MKKKKRNQDSIADHRILRNAIKSEKRAILQRHFRRLWNRDGRHKVDGYQRREKKPIKETEAKNEKKGIPYSGQIYKRIRHTERMHTPRPKAAKL